MLAMALILWSCAQAKGDALLPTGFQPPVMAAAQYVKKPIRGDLGGVLVEIPSHMAEYLEYDGDPGWKGGENNHAPRTSESKIRTFGVDVLYPEMMGKSSIELRKNFSSRIYEATNWIYIVVVSGEGYSGDGSINKLATASLARKLDPDGEFFWNRYEKLSQKQFGLEVYVPNGVDPKTGTSYRNGEHAKDIFVARNLNGEAVSYISCNHEEAALARCTHRFNMAPYMSAHLAVHYRRGLLSEWSFIQDRVYDLFAGFAVKS